MQFHLGRLIDHVHLRVSDLDVSKRFYRAVLASLDLSALLVEGVDYFYLDELFVDRASGVVSHVHLAFQAPDRATVDKFHVAALAAGGFLTSIAAIYFAAHIHRMARLASQ